MQTLNASPLKDHDVSKLLYNRPKNRFANIFPCEYTAAVSSVQCGLWPACHCAVCPLACMSLCSVASGLHVTVQCMSLCSVASGLHVTVQCGLWPACHCAVWPLACMSLCSACHCAVWPLACMSLCSVVSGLHVTVQCGLWPACHCAVWPLACMSLCSVASGLHVTVWCSCPLSSDDESRVLLEEIPGEEGSDYINASWIDVNAAIIYS